MSKNLVDIETISADEFVRLRLEALQRRKQAIEEEEAKLNGLISGGVTHNSGGKPTTPVPPVTPVYGGLIDQVRKVVRENPGLTSKEIAKFIVWDAKNEEMKINKVRWTINSLLDKKEIVGHGERNKTYTMKK